jgi:nucleotide-binding universal stress UspA family protein
MKTILYATDYSKDSATALKMSHLLAKKFGSKLFIMHVFDVPLTLASSVSVSYMNKEKRLIVENRSKLKKFCTEHLGDALQENNTNFVIDEDGSAADSIVEKATKYNVDLIVVGTKGTSRVKEFFLGSTTKALIKKALFAVMAVPKMHKIGAFETIAYATDFEQVDIFAIGRLIPIAKLFNSQIRIVHITTSNEYAGDQQMEWFKEMLQQKVEYGNLEFDLILSDNVFRELQDYLDNKNVSILAMLERRNNTFFEKYIQQDMVKKMVDDITIPLLSFNEKGL